MMARAQTAFDSGHPGGGLDRTRSIVERRPHPPQSPLSQAADQHRVSRRSGSDEDNALAVA